ncbi:GGDEF domain-containing protein [Blautia sp. MSJ-19]|uniref:GGDEF domain-containing protein n=1 Tax=Blautia sp. MSJ-19 TaxID=2841517 RepID=UPI001C0EE8E7|nr:GGDEF domain-containing protein [Blautia sp. MSJ-19]MBU5480491.1 GGDEF domain-containing protein [Blautia sp. MSJ-19]
MKKIALITDARARYATYAWIRGYRRYTADRNLPADLYVFHSFGSFSKDKSYNAGEYNITRLPDLSTFDAILLDIATIPDKILKEEIIMAAQKASVPVISLLEKVPGLYHSGIDDYTAVRTLVDHLITEHGCRKLNYVGGPVENYENQQRFLAYKETLLKHNLPFEPNRVTGYDYEVETGLQAFARFQSADLLPDAFVCANDNIAAGICLAARDAGFSVPNDFLVTGFDNDTKAAYLDPPITTVDFSKTDIMYHALQLLTDIWDGRETAEQVFASVRHIYRESCQCHSSEASDPGQYVSNQIMEEVRHGNMLDWMMELDRFLLECSSFTELASRLHTWLLDHDCGNLYLLMNPDIFLLENVDSLPEIPDDLYRSIGYPDSMTVVYPQPDKTCPQQLNLMLGNLLPDSEISDTTKAQTPHVYLFASVHFREREIGYLVLKNCDYLVEHQFLFKTLNTFRTSIEALYGKLILRKKNKQLSQLYIHDSLTGLYNRMAYEKLALPMFQKYIQGGQTVGIMFIDADHLKYINDNFGHDMGNLAISSIASVIRQQCPLNSVSMRYGGDEFVCVIPNYSQTQMEQLKQHIAGSLRLLSENSHMAFPIEASIGYVVADDPIFSLNDYINLADEKMYAEKKARKAARE